MKTINTLALVAALSMLAGYTALAQPSPANPTPPPNDANPPSQPPPCWGRPGMQARHQALLEKYDANKDGILETSELAAIGKDVENGTFRPMMLRGGRRGMGGMAYGPGRHGFGRRGEMGMGPNRRGYGPPAGMGYGPGPRGPRGPYAWGGPGFGPRHQQMLDRYDANHNGTLGPSERAAIRKDVADGRFQRPGFGRGPHGFGPPPAAPDTATPNNPPATNGSPEQ